MLQLLQNLGNGETLVADVPAPGVAEGTLLIATRRSLVSAGTERMLVDFGRGSLLDKARQQPEKVKMVLDKVRTDGLFATIEAVRSKLDQPLALGYCNVGEVIEVGRGVEGFAPGDRVASNGPHAQVVRVPRNLCAKVPDQVDDETAAFTVLSAIALQGIRLTVQLLRASGCRVLGVDLDRARIELARVLGAETCDLSAGDDPIARGLAFSLGRGVDGVIVAASTQSSAPIEQAARMSRKRGRIVLVGVTGLELNRADFYEKELTFQVSCSYGPGRYDPSYEAEGHDYPIGFVRWTEQRNLQAVLAMMAKGALDVRALISHRFAIGDAARAYDTLLNDRAALGILLSYAGSADTQSLPALKKSSVTLAPAPDHTPGGQSVVAMVGAGNYGSRVLLPALRAAGAQFDTLVTSGGASGFHHGRKWGFARASTDFARDVLANPRINTVVIATRHDSHARLAAQSLAAGLHVFVEKPLAISVEGVAQIENALAQATRAGKSPLLMVGFNRRFAPLVVKLKELLARTVEPKAFVYTINAGAIAPDHWTQNLAIGGGRIVGEACHFIDLLRHLAGCAVVGHNIATIGPHTAVPVPSDNAMITLRFADGSIGAIHYLANGGKQFEKERLEVFCGNGVLALSNFLRLTGYGWPGFRGLRLWRQDKGQAACVAAFIDAIRNGGPPPIALDEIIETSKLALALAQGENLRIPMASSLSPQERDRE